MSAEGGPFPGERLFVAGIAATGLLPAAVIAILSKNYFWLNAYVAGLLLVCYAQAVFRRVRLVRGWPTSPGSFVVGPSPGFAGAPPKPHLGSADRGDSRRRFVSLLLRDDLGSFQLAMIRFLFIASVGLLPLWAAIAFVVYLARGDSSTLVVTPWLIIFAVPVCAVSLLLVLATLAVHRRVEGDALRKFKFSAAAFGEYSDRAARAARRCRRSI